jgi:leucyl-tRNA synthetase
MYVLFAGPPERDFDWSDAQVQGQQRFLHRVWALAHKHHAACAGASHAGPFDGKALEIRRVAHKLIKRVGGDIERLSFNTAIAGMMECVNALYLVTEISTPAEKAAMGEAVRALALVMTPFAPHFADEVFSAYGGRATAVEQAWPTFDPALVVDDELTYAIQIKGKLKGEVKVPVAATEADVRAAAEAEEKVKAALAGQTIKKVVFVPKKLINFVV